MRFVKKYTILPIVIYLLACCDQKHINLHSMKIINFWGDLTDVSATQVRAASTLQNVFWCRSLCQDLTIFSHNAMKQQHFRGDL